MKVAVCDDNFIFLEEMKEKLEKETLVSDVNIFSSPLELILQVNEGVKYDMAFLDLDLGTKEQKTGLQWGEELIKSMPDISIVFITGYNDRFAQHVLLTNVNPVGYMTKPVNEKVLQSYLKKAAKSKVEPKYLIISRHGSKISINVDEIIHIESHDHKVFVFTETENFTIYEKLNDVLNRLTKEFIQTHKSFAVNMNWIKSIEGKTIVLRNGKDIPISRAYSNNVKDNFFRFIGEKI